MSNRNQSNSGNSEANSVSTNNSKIKELIRQKILRTQAKLTPKSKAKSRRRRVSSLGDVQRKDTNNPKQITNRRSSLPSGSSAQPISSNISATGRPEKKPELQPVHAAKLMEAQPLPSRIVSRSLSTSVVQIQKRHAREENRLGWSSRLSQDRHHRHSWQYRRDRDFIMYQMGVKNCPDSDSD